MNDAFSDLLVNLQGINHMKTLLFCMHVSLTILTTGKTYLLDVGYVVVRVRVVRVRALSQIISEESLSRSLHHVFDRLGHSPPFPGRALISYMYIFYSVPYNDPVMQVAAEFNIHYGRKCLISGTLLYPDHYSLTLIVFGIQLKFTFVVSDYPWINFALGVKYLTYMFCSKVSVSFRHISHSTAITQPICRFAVCINSYQAELVRPSSSSRATIVSAEN